VANDAIQRQRRSGSCVDTNTLQQIEQKLLSWTPGRPLDFTDTFTPEEILRMETQAAMYRSAGLLLCHRIRYPIGTLDDIAISFASSILFEFSKYITLCGSTTELPSVTCPILLAAFEIPDVSAEVWERLPLLHAAHTCFVQTLSFVNYVWLRRRCGYEGFVFDLVDDGPAFTVIP
jgi:hypothetical protein